MKKQRRKGTMAILSLSFLLGVLFAGKIPVQAEANLLKTALIEGVEYILDTRDFTAEASIEVHNEDAVIPEEVTVRNKITYEGDTYGVVSFDVAYDTASAPEDMIIRDPYSLSRNQKTMRKLTIEKGINELGVSFSNYLALEEVVFENPKDMKRAGLYFYNCPKLKDLYIPANIDVLPTLRKCPNTEVIFASDHPKYKVKGGDIYSKNGKILYSVPKGEKTYKVRKSVRKIGYGAFCGNDNIHKIVLSPSVKKVGLSAFRDMQNLRTIKLSKNMKAVSGDMFKKSKQLKTIIFPSNIRKIDGGFGGKYLCKLKKIYIKAPVMKKVNLIGLPKKCKVYVKNSTVSRQVRKEGFKGKIIITKRMP